MHLPAVMAIVGRDREQAELATALASTRAGYGRAVLLLGEAGMGKSMLAGGAATSQKKPSAGGPDNASPELTPRCRVRRR